MTLRIRRVALKASYRGLKHISSINFHPSKMFFKWLLGCNPQDPGGCPSRMTCDPTTRKCRYLSCDSSIENGVLKYFANETLITSKNVRHPNAVGHTAHVSCNEGHLINHVEEYEWLRDFKHYDIQGSMANGNQNHWQKKWAYGSKRMGAFWLPNLYYFQILKVWLNADLTT